MTFGFFGGSLLGDELRLALAGDGRAWLRAALREAAEEGGAGRGPELVSVQLPELATRREDVIRIWIVFRWFSMIFDGF